MYIFKLYIFEGKHQYVRIQNTQLKGIRMQTLVHDSEQNDAARDAGWLLHRVKGTLKRRDRLVIEPSFNHAAKKYPNDRLALMEMYRVLNSIDFKTPEELRAVFPSLDNFKYKDRWWVLDVGGNNLRMMAFIQFVNGRIYIKHIVNHADYDTLTVKYRKRPIESFNRNT